MDEMEENGFTCYGTYGNIIHIKAVNYGLYGNNEKEDNRREGNTSQAGSTSEKMSAGSPEMREGAWPYTVLSYNSWSAETCIHQSEAYRPGAGIEVQADFAGKRKTAAKKHFAGGKNTAGINVLLNQIDKYKREKELLIILNDAENDGRDISWFWNIDFEKIKDNLDKSHIIFEKIKGFNKVFCSGTRAEEVAIALKVNNIDVKKIIVKNNFDDAISKLLISKNQKYIITNYSSLLKVRNILSNKER